MDKTKQKKLQQMTQNFVRSETAGGVVMLAAAALALILANSPLSGYYKSLLSMPMTFGLGPYFYAEPFKVWVKDALMVLFFFAVGMELKWEMGEGFQSDRKTVLLPLAAAVCGMAVPALIFLGLNHDQPEYWPGWAISSATDIAFAMCVLLMAGKCIPPALKTFLLTVAIFDDLGAILVIAIFYSGEIFIPAILLGIGGGYFLYWMNKVKITYIPFYLLAGAFIWFCFHAGGVHTTVAGGLTGFFIPLKQTSKNGFSPLKACLHFIHPWVSLLILPVFAFTAAGLTLKGVDIGDAMLHPLTISIILSLFLGKQLGIFGGSWLIIKLGYAQLPPDITWKNLYGASVLAGIGFTMSLLIGFLAFGAPELQDHVMMGVLVGSLMSAIWGWYILRCCRDKQK